MKITARHTSFADREYILKLVQTIDPRKTKPVTSIALPGEKAENSFLMAIMGEEREYRLNFILYDDGTDKSNGTGLTQFPAGVKTVSEQIEWIEEYIHSPFLGVEWTISGGRFGTGKKVHLEEVVIPENAQNPLTAEGTITLKVGEVLI